MPKARAAIRMPPGVACRGLTAEQAAAYVGVSLTKFQAAVDAGKLPAGKEVVPGCVRWDRAALDRLFDPSSKLPPDQEAMARLDQWRRSA